MLKLADTVGVQQHLLSWFTDNQRNLPWRSGYDPYQVWISEIMGQQTQMGRVVQYFNRWVQLFPDVQAVASADEQQILKAWEGLGYYSRAKNIHRTAQVLVNEYAARVPSDIKSLLSLPGIGSYTAAAILSIAYNKPYPLVDANVKRLFSRLLDIDQPLKGIQVQKILQKCAEKLLSEVQPRQLNQALMEFGALVCTPKSPACPACPLTKFCRADQQGTVSMRPVVAPKAEKIEIVMACGIIFHEQAVYIQQRLPDDLWGSLWEFPGGQLKEGETPREAACREVLEETGLLLTEVEPFATVVHQFTKYRVTLHGFTCQLAEQHSVPDLQAASQFRWVSLSELPDFPFPSGHRKLVATLCPEKLQEKMKI